MVAVTFDKSSYNGYVGGNPITIDGGISDDYSTTYTVVLTDGQGFSSATQSVPFASPYTQKNTWNINYIPTSGLVTQLTVTIYSGTTQIASNTVFITLSQVSTTISSTTYSGYIGSFVTIRGSINDLSKTYYLQLTDSLDNASSLVPSSPGIYSNSWSINYTLSLTSVKYVVVTLYASNSTTSALLSSSNVAITVFEVSMGIQNTSYSGYIGSAITITGNIDDSSKPYYLQLTDSLGNASSLVPSSPGNNSNSWSINYTLSSTSVTYAVVTLYASNDTTSALLASSNVEIIVSQVSMGISPTSYSGYFGGNPITITGYINDVSKTYYVRLTDSLSNVSNIVPSFLGSNSNTWSISYTLSSTSVKYAIVSLYASNSTTSALLASSNVEITVYEVSTGISPTSYSGYFGSTISITGNINDPSKPYYLQLTDSQGNASSLVPSSPGNNSNTWSISYTLSSTSVTYAIVSLYAGNDTTSALLASSNVAITFSQVSMDISSTSYSGYIGSAITIRGNINDPSKTYYLQLTDSLGNASSLVPSSPTNVYDNRWSINYTLSSTSVTYAVVTLYANNSTTSTLLASSNVAITVYEVSMGIQNTSYSGYIGSAITITGNIDDSSKTYYLQLTDSLDNASDIVPSSPGNNSNSWSINYNLSSTSVTYAIVRLYASNDATSALLASSNVEIQVAKATPTIYTVPYATLPINFPVNQANLSGGNASVAGRFEITNTDVPNTAGPYSTIINFKPNNETNYETVFANIDVLVLELSFDSKTYTYDVPTTISGRISDIGNTYTLTWSDDHGHTSYTNTTSGAWSFNYTPNYVGNITVTVSFGNLSGNVVLDIAKATPTIYTVPYATLPFNFMANAATLTGGNTSVHGKFEITDTTVRSNAGPYTTTVNFTPEDETNYNTVSANITVQVAKGFPIIYDVPYATLPFNSMANAATLTGGNASVPGDFEITDTTIRSNAGPYATTVNFTPEDETNYNTVSANITVQVAKGFPIIYTVPYATLPINFPVNLANLTGGNASVDGRFEITNTDAPNTPGDYPTTVYFIPDDETNYETVSANIDVLVLQLSFDSRTYTYGVPTTISGTISDTGNSYTLTWADDRDRTSYTTTNSGVWSFDYTPASAGNITLTVSSGDLSANTTVQVAKATPNIIDVPYATLPINLRANQANLTGGNASVTGSFEITDETLCLTAGAYTTTVYFRPTYSNNYNTVSAPIVIHVQSFEFTQSAYKGYVGYSMRISGTNQSTNNYTLNLTDRQTQTIYDTTTSSSFDFTFTPANTSPVTLYVDAVDSGSVLYSSDPISFTPEVLTFPTAPDAILAWDLVFAKPHEVLDVGDSQEVPVVLTPNTLSYTDPTYGVTLVVGASSVRGIMILRSSNTTVDSFTWDVDSHTDVLMKDGTFGEDHVFVSEQQPFTQYGITLSSVPNLPDIDENIPQNIFYSPQENSYYITDGFITLPCTLALVQLTSYLENPVTTSTVRVDVKKSTPVLTQISADALNVGETLGDATVTGVARNPWDPSLFVDGIFMFLYPQTVPGLADSETTEYTVDFTPSVTDSSRYHAASGKATVTVNKLTPTLALPGMVTVEYGTRVTVANLGVSVNPDDLAGSYSLSSEGVLDVGTYVIEVRFTPESSLYNHVVASTVLTVESATPEVTWPTLGSIYYGQSVGDSQMQGAVGAGDFSLLGPDRVPTTVGTTQATIFFDPHDEINYDSLTQVSSILVERTTPDVSALTTTPIYYDETLNQTIISGAFNPYTGQGIPGTYLIANGQGATQPDVGNREIQVDFTPSNLEVYTTSSTMVIVPVYSSNVVVSNVAVTAIYYGQTLDKSVVTGVARNQTTEKVVTERGGFSFVDSATFPQVADSNVTAYPAVFTPSTSNLNTSDPVLLTLAVLPTTPVLSGLTASDIIFGSNVSTSTITGSATNPFDHVDVPGTFAFEDPTYAPDDGNAQVFSVIFTPSANVAANYVSTVTGSVAVNVVEDNVKQIVNLVATAGTTMIRLTWKDPNSFGLIAGYYVYVDGNLRSPLLMDPEVLLTGLVRNTEYRIGVSLVAVSGKIYPLEKVIATTERSDASALALSTVPGVPFTLATPLRAYRCIFRHASKTATITLAVDSTGWARQATLATQGGTSVMIGVSPGKDPYFVVYEFGADGSVTESAVRQTVLVHARLRWSKFYIGSAVDRDPTKNKIVILHKDKRASLALKMYNNYDHELVVGLR